MTKLRALIVDDAAVMRRLVAEALQRDPAIEVAGSAPNGRAALKLIDEIKPDFVTLDMEMPELDGIATLREIRRAHPKLPVIMFSLATRRGAAATLDALAAGASDYVAKPSASAGLDASLEQLARDILPKIRAHCGRLPAAVPAPVAAEIRAKPRPAKKRASDQFALLAIASSTGGPNALAALFSGLSRDIAVPIVIVQHMPPLFTSMLAERLSNEASGINCREATEGETLSPGQAYIAPGGLHLAVERRADGTFISRLLETPPENSCRPAADVLFRSIAETGARTLTVVLTGMGEDGMRGCELLARQDAEILVQDQATSVVWGMPGSVARAGLADATLPLASIATEINRRIPLRPRHP